MHDAYMQRLKLKFVMQNRDILHLHFFFFLKAPRLSWQSLQFTWPVQSHWPNLKSFTPFQANVPLSLLMTMVKISPEDSYILWIWYRYHLMAEISYECDPYVSWWLRYLMNVIQISLEHESATSVLRQGQKIFLSIFSRVLFIPPQTSTLSSLKTSAASILGHSSFIPHIPFSHIRIRISSKWPKLSRLYSRLYGTSCGK